MSEFPILYLSRDLVAIEKPAGVPSESDPSGDADAMMLTARALSARGEKDALYLVHRLDRTVGGILLFARTSAAAARLSAAFADRACEKRYLAIAHGVPDEGEYRDFLYKDAKAGKSFVVSSARRGAKEASLSVKRLAVCENGAYSLLSVSLVTGRFHQIRCQLASRGHPLVGDHKYGSRAEARLPALYASGLILPGEDLSLSALPDLSAVPWNLFSKECYPL